MINTYIAVKYEKTYRVCTLMRRPHLSPPVDGCVFEFQSINAPFLPVSSCKSSALFSSLKK
jgi:hypothetical protein